MVKRHLRLLRSRSNASKRSNQVASAGIGRADVFLGAEAAATQARHARAKRHGWLVTAAPLGEAAAAGGAGLAHKSRALLRCTIVGSPHSERLMAYFYGHFFGHAADAFSPNETQLCVAGVHVRTDVRS